MLGTNRRTSTAKNAKTAAAARIARFSSRGLTLVEVLVAVTILSIALLAYVTVISSSRDAFTDGGEFSLASQAITDEISQLRGGTGYPALVYGTTTTKVAGLPKWTMTLVVKALPQAPTDTNIKEIDITVTWAPAKLGGKSTRSLQESTFMSNHP